uniref:Uncharacterized protein n=1 Tax=Glossina brevipalpis TaxID=37001 RepID=A0A1A9WWS6_9MUSC
MKLEVIDSLNFKLFIVLHVRACNGTHTCTYNIRKTSSVLTTIAAAAAAAAVAAILYDTMMGGCLELRQAVDPAKPIDIRSIVVLVRLSNESYLTARRLESTKEEIGRTGRHRMSRSIIASFPRHTSNNAGRLTYCGRFESHQKTDTKRTIHQRSNNGNSNSTLTNNTKQGNRISSNSRNNISSGPTLYNNQQTEQIELKIVADFQEASSNSVVAVAFQGSSNEGVFLCE